MQLHVCNQLVLSLDLLLTITCYIVLVYWILWPSIGTTTKLLSLVWWLAAWAAFLVMFD